MSKLREEKYDGTEEILRQYVVSRFTEEPRLETEWDTPVGDKKRSIYDLTSYVTSKAHEVANGKTAIAVEDKVVFGWVNHYLEEEGREIVAKTVSTEKELDKNLGLDKEPKPKEEPKPKSKKVAKEKPKEQGTQLPLFSL